VKALDRGVLKRFRERAARSKPLTPEILGESDAGLIDKLHLKDGSYLKRAALLLFHPDPERFVAGAFIKIGRFQTNSDLLHHDEIHGDLFAQVDKIMDLLLTKYLAATIRYEGLQRVETYPVPEEALREALLNAVAHKDYSSHVPIQISVYDDRILFWNNGELPPGWTVETLTRKHSSQPFNPDVANVFFRAGMIESWGRGIERIIAACKAAGVPVPLLRYEGAGLWVEFRVPSGTRATAPVTGELEGAQPESRLESRLESALAGKLLIILKDRELGRAALAAALGHTSISGELHKQIKRLKTAGLIEMTMPQKPNSRLQKYRITDNGAALLAAMREGASSQS
jgi:ATP-dependent DNA helicase RecG